MTIPNENIRVPGHSNATFVGVPECHQLFDIHLLDIAPTPVPMDRNFFVLMRGEIAPSKARELGLRIDDTLLADATITGTMEVTYANGEVAPSESATVPLRTAHSPGSNLAFRQWGGGAQDQLVVGVRQDILADTLIWSESMRTGTYTWTFEAMLPGGECLFAVQLSQWLEGKEVLESMMASSGPGADQEKKKTL